MTRVPDSWTLALPATEAWITARQARRSWNEVARVAAEEMGSALWSHPTAWQRLQLGRLQRASLWDAARAAHDAADEAALGDLQPGVIERSPAWLYRGSPLLTLDETHALMIGNPHHPSWAALPEGEWERRQRQLVSQILQTAWLLHHVPLPEQTGEVPVDFIARHVVDPVRLQLQAVAFARVRKSSAARVQA